MREMRTSLKELRMESGFTQSELAEIVGNCRDNISRLERNKFKNPTYQLLYDIAEFFENCSVNAEPNTTVESSLYVAKKFGSASLLT